MRQLVLMKQRQTCSDCQTLAFVEFKPVLGVKMFQQIDAVSTLTCITTSTVRRNTQGNYYILLVLKIDVCSIYEGLLADI